MADKPRFTHDCTACRFLGQFEKWDLYYCPTYMLMEGSCIARYGSEGHEYASLACDIIRFNLEELKLSNPGTRAVVVAYLRNKRG